MKQTVKKMMCERSPLCLLIQNRGVVVKIFDDRMKIKDMKMHNKDKNM